MCLNEKWDLAFEQRKKKIGVSHQVHYDKNELVYGISPAADTKSGEEECQEGKELLAKKGTPLER